MTESAQQVVLITGAHGQVGQAVTSELQAKARLALVNRRPTPPPGLTTSADLTYFGGVNLSDEVAVAAAVAAVRSQLGPVRSLVHTVGAYSGGTAVLAQTADLLQNMLEVNYLAAATIVRAVLPDILGAPGGNIVLFASADALHGRAGASAYAASKAALLRFAEALAEEITPQGVGVRVILPTTIDTPSNRAAMPKAQFADWVTPGQIAQTVAFLIGPASAGIRYAAIPMGR